MNNNTEWITYRPPTREDGNKLYHKVWVTYRNGEVGQEHWSDVKPPTPWQHIQDKPGPYVKPKRWTVDWNTRDLQWKLYDWDLVLLALQGLTEDDADAAQRIADIYNEVMP